MELCLPEQKPAGIADSYLRIGVSRSTKYVRKPFVKVCRRQQIVNHLVGITQVAGHALAVVVQG